VAQLAARQVARELIVGGLAEQRIDDDRVLRAGIGDDEPNAVGRRHLEGRRERAPRGVVGGERAVAQGATRRARECDLAPARASQRAFDGELEHEIARSVRRRPRLEREALLESLGRVPIPLDHAGAADLDALLRAGHLPRRNVRERFAAPDAQERQLDQTRAAARGAVVHANAARLEPGAQVVTPVGRLEALRGRARPVLARGDVLLRLRQGAARSTESRVRPGSQRGEIRAGAEPPRTQRRKREPPDSEPPSHRRATSPPRHAVPPERAAARSKGQSQRWRAPDLIIC
jgi:hypothetical protein